MVNILWTNEELKCVSIVSEASVVHTGEAGPAEEASVLIPSFE
jgi:hypothetical protein